MNHKETMIRLNAALNRVDACYAEIGRKFGLTFNALMMVYLIGESQAITQKQLSDALHLPKSTVHSILAELIKGGHVRLVEGGNRKEKRIVATETGGAFLARIQRDTERIESRVLDAFGHDESAKFLASAERLAHLLQMETAKMRNESGDGDGG